MRSGGGDDHPQEGAKQRRFMAVADGLWGEAAEVSGVPKGGEREAKRDAREAHEADGGGGERGDREAEEGDPAEGIAAVDGEVDSE